MQLPVGLTGIFLGVQQEAVLSPQAQLTVLYTVHLWVQYWEICLKKQKNKIKKRSKMKMIEELIKSGRATIVDVRTPAEFMGGHVNGSVNIPLKELPTRLEEFKTMKNIVLCCASGNRSGQAAAYLQQNGISCENAGSWLEVNCYC